MAEYNVDINNNPVDLSQPGDLDTGHNIPLTPGRTQVDSTGYVANTPNPMDAAARKEQLLTQQQAQELEQQKLQLEQQEQEEEKEPEKTDRDTMFDLMGLKAPEIPVKSPEVPIEAQEVDKYEDYERDAYNYIANPSLYNGPYRDLYSKFTPEGLQSYLSQVRNLQFTNPMGTVQVTDIPGHLEGAARLAETAGLDPDQALFNLTALAAAAEDGAAQEGIEYYLVTGEVKNRFAAEFDQIFREINNALENGQIGEDEAAIFLDQAIDALVSDQGYFDRNSAKAAMIDAALQLAGYGVGTIGSKALTKFGSKALRAASKSKLGNKFAATKIGRKVVDSKVASYMDDLARSAGMIMEDGKIRVAGEGVPMSEADAKIITAATEEDQKVFFDIVENLEKQGLKGQQLDDAFEAAIKKLPKKQRASINRVLDSTRKIAEIDPDGFLHDYIDASLDPEITPEAFENRVAAAKYQIERDVRFDAAELARYLKAKNAREAGGTLGAAAGYIAGAGASGPLANLLNGTGRPADDIHVDRGSEDVTRAVVDNHKQVSNMLPDMPEITNLLDDKTRAALDPYIKAAEAAHKSAEIMLKATGGLYPETENALLEADEQLKRAIDNVNGSIAKGNPERMKKLRRDLGEIDDTSTRGMPKTWLGAYFAGEFGDPKSKDAKRTLAFFALDALGTALLNSSAAIQKRQAEKTTWQKGQGTRLENAYGRYNLARETELNAQITDVVEAYKLDMDAADNLRRLFAETNLKNYYNRLDDNRKLELIEKVARYAPLFSRFNDDQLALFTKLMMNTGMVNRDEFNLMLSYFKPGDISAMLANTKKSAERVAYRQVQQAEEAIKQAAASAKLTKEQADLYRIKVYSDIAAGATDAAFDIIKQLGLIGK